MVRNTCIRPRINWIFYLQFVRKRKVKDVAALSNFRIAMKKIIRVLKNASWILAFAPTTLLVGCIDPNAGSYPNSYGNGNSGFGGGYGDPYYRQRRDLDDDRRETDRERRDIENERQRIEEDQRRLERERERSRQYSPPPSPPQRREESCPSGFSPSENKCSSEDRRRGCRDMRLPGGLGCVSR